MEKVLTAAALIDSGTASRRPRSRCPSSCSRATAPSRTHFTHEPEPKINMRASSPDSSNIGTALLARQMDKARLRDYLQLRARARPASSCRGSRAASCRRRTCPICTRDQVAFGQALAVTGMQEAAALAGI